MLKLTTAIVIATDLLVWKLLRHDMRLERPTAERIVTEMVNASPPDKPRSQQSVESHGVGACKNSDFMS